MRILLIGLNHRSAPIAVRERLAVGEGELGDVLRALQAHDAIREVALLSTCNRVEVTVVTHDPEDAISAVHEWMAKRAGIELAALLPHLYRHLDGEAVRHLFAVAAGLDSLVLGEPQILGQVKVAYEHACAAGSAGHVLHRLYQAAFAAAKRARTETAIGKEPVSIASCAVDLARRIFGDLSGKRVLLIGAGEMAELAATHLKSAGCSDLLIANRTLARAEALAAELGGHALSLDEVPSWLEAVDIVISSTGSPRYLLTPQIVRPALARRSIGRPLFLIDIAAPRDIDPRVGELDDVYLYDIDDLDQVAEQNRNARRAEAERAQAIIAEEAERFFAWLRSLEAVPLIRAIQRRAESILSSELARARTKGLASLSEDELAAVERTMRGVVKKLLHPALAELKHLPEDIEGDLLLGAAARLFGIEEEKHGRRDRRSA